MLYSQEVIENVRQSNDIIAVVESYLPLKRKGSSYFGLCPFHNEGTPSFSVNPDKQLYYCFGCGASGNVISFIMQMENENFPEALKRLADRAGIVLPEENVSAEAKKNEQLRERLFEINKEAGRFYYSQFISDEGAQAREYALNRGMRPELCKKFGIGYASRGKDKLSNHLEQSGFKREDIITAGLAFETKDGVFMDKFYNRLMFPIFDAQGRVIGFGGRQLGKGEPKYLNSPETPVFNKSKNLYGLNFARRERRRDFILVEGYMDMFTIYQAGFKNVVASLGTAFNDNHAQTLKRFADEVILLYDSDEAGTNAALRAIPTLLNRGFEVKVAQVPDGKDPDEFIKKNGAKEFSKILIDAQSHIKFKISQAKRNYNLSNTEHKIKFTREAAKILSELESAVEAEAYAEDISKETEISRQTILSEVRRIKNNDETSFAALAQRKRKTIYDDANIQKTKKGVMLAQANFLAILATNAETYDKVKKYISPQDFDNETHARLCETLYDAYANGKEISLAALVANFEDIEQQRMAGQALSLKTTYNSRQELEKSLNESLKAIKLNSLDKKIADNNDIAKLQMLITERSNVDKLYISLING